MNERIKKLRKTLDFTQQEFADKLGIKRNTVATYERGNSDPSDAAVVLICREFNVSEAWLRTGEGEMFVQLPRNEALAAQIKTFLQGGTDSFRERLVSLLLRLSPDQWDALEGYLLELMGPRASAPTVPAFSPADEVECAPLPPGFEDEARSKAELYYQQLLSEQELETPASSANESVAG